MNVIDSCGWLEFLADGSNAKYFAEPLADMSRVVVPAICVYEVCKRIMQLRNESLALEAVAMMYQGTVVPLSGDLALEAAQVSIETHLAMADSIILTTARRYKAVVWTQDADFEGMDGVKYFGKTEESNDPV